MPEPVSKKVPKHKTTLGLPGFDKITNQITSALIQHFNEEKNKKLIAN